MQNRTFESIRILVQRRADGEMKHIEIVIIDYQSWEEEEEFLRERDK